MSEWKTIASAPKDKDIQLWGRWQGGPGQWFPFCFFSIETGAWFSSASDDFRQFDEGWEFTHWMPFPSPPSHT